MTVQKGAIPKLTLESVRVRAVEVPLRRPIVAKVGAYSSWPMMLIDVTTREGIVGRSYLEPYVKKSIKSIAQLTQDLADLFKDKPLAPLDCYRDAMRVMHLNGREGMTLIAIAGLDMAIWDALAKAANLPLAALLGGTTGKVRAYNTNGLWLVPLEQVPHEAEELSTTTTKAAPSSRASSRRRSRSAKTSTVRVSSTRRSSRARPISTCRISCASAA
ncbi:MAG TPA: hypothetical protein VEV20_10170 [Burkholderiales bacterium]|nr:hypothetical protein [Burkholderiales bacterium]